MPRLPFVRLVRIRGGLTSSGSGPRARGARTRGPAATLIAHGSTLLGPIALMAAALALEAGKRWC